MKGFRQYITERLAIEDNPNAYTPSPIERTSSPTLADIMYDRRQKRLYGGVMSRVAARMLARAKSSKQPPKPTREPFPWLTKKGSLAGWWHPTLQWFTFSHDTDGYHVTQIVKKPQAFGLSTTALNHALAAEADYLKGTDSSYYDLDSGDPHDADSVRSAILKRDIDLAWEVQKAAYDKGWLKVYGGYRPTMEGTSVDSIRAALREIRDIGTHDGTVGVIRMEGRGKEKYSYPSAKNNWQTA